LEVASEGAVALARMSFGRRVGLLVEELRVVEIDAMLEDLNDPGSPQIYPHHFPYEILSLVDFERNRIQFKEEEE
jgi:hypothetical protein